MQTCHQLVRIKLKLIGSGSRRVFHSRAISYGSLNQRSLCSRNLFSYHGCNYIEGSSSIGKLQHHCKSWKRLLSTTEIQRSNGSEARSSTDSPEVDAGEDILPSRSGDLYTDEYMHPSQGHRVLIIYPVTKRQKRSSELLASLDHDLEETCGLVEALPGWSVAGKALFKLKGSNAVKVFSKGIFEEVTEKVRKTPKTAVLMDVGMLTCLQLVTLQREWKCPVYDRYTVILQIFRSRAKTREAKLQLALAELPYYKSRLHGMHRGYLTHQSGGLSLAGGTGETWIETRANILADREKVIRAKLADIQRRREIHRQERKKKEIPVVAVVGYTNSGKTSLIKVLTQDASLQPWDQVFATLDVTCHGGYLPNKLKVVYMDTVGFISNIPTDLIQSFRATLEEIATADAIVHVRDASHPETERQKETVLQTLKSLDLEPQVIDSIIEINNKCDLIEINPGEMNEGEIDEVTREEAAAPICTSTVTGQGLPHLLQQIETNVLKHTDRDTHKLKIPCAGPHYRWLIKEATVSSAISCDSDPEFLLVDAVMTQSAYARFRSKFGSKKSKKKRHNNN